ncbi:hypothetical protein BX616_009378 [Lobosporangium transversale]|uniref:Transferase n=1 Tax=Lobosporangium transversale TaxID=64571 RepID=A0A1Y2GDF6_9FUNG|nr:transferase [Lobosporangium transversale]KAF9913890.1 hypothetical protein BX616_009378 [Lobosporangium transversale]ORZ07759.1 transferase [Lobosporangium transversale]|eukprot:XP_021878125.1 transferase [Lobosporangium transversale]
MTVKTYTIFPSNKYNLPPPPSVIVLHGLDLMNPPSQIQNRRFFHPSTRPFSEVIEKLTSSLAEALELYPPVTGTVRTNEGKDEIYIALDPANIQGTPFLVETKDTPFVGDTDDVSPRNDQILLPLAKILMVKVTQFSCGTIAVASSINHEVTDLRGFLDFLELWAQIARGEPIDFKDIPNDWSHNPGQYFSGLFKNSTGKTLPSPPPPLKVVPAQEAGICPFFFQPSFVSRWRFTKNTLEQLKSDFSPTSGDLWISTGDALSSLISGVITRAREKTIVERLEGRSSSESQIEQVAMAANGRERAPQGNMSKQYFGNFNTLWSAAVSRPDLLSPTFEAASRVAVAIRTALNVQLSAEAIANKIAFFEDPKNSKLPNRIVWVADMVLTSWCQFDLKGPKLDFGWGKPFAATAGNGAYFPPGYSVMIQEKDTGDIYVVLGVETAGAEELKADQLLNKYATMLPA